MAPRYWTYSYGHKRRGFGVRTGEADQRPLGIDTVYLCRRCERSVLRANFGELARGHRSELLLASLALVGFLLGVRYVETHEMAVTAWVVLAAVSLWVAFNWAIRRPKAMCRGVFLLRRKELAARHGLKPDQLEPYLEDLAW